ncbi:YhdP family protein [Marinobacter fonticola]|uniref:YhdP family protein n=1 Tax=Marinobacter fonticola TaxID=2603215 RepID=UPI0011E81DF9|nr:YhdP family protein [Marinobacter fonticola]
MEATSSQDEVEKSRALRWIERSANLIWGLVLALLIVVALYVVIGRQLVSAVGDYRQELEAELSQRLGQPVHIDGLEGRWRGFDPVILIAGIEVEEVAPSNEPAARIDSIRIRLDALTSLLRQRLVFSDFIASGLDLTLEQTPSGAMAIQGVPLAHSSVLSDETSAEKTAGGPRAWIDKLGGILSDPSVQLNQLRLGLKVPEEELRTFFIPQVDLLYERGVFSASGRAMQPGSAIQLARFYLKGEHFFRGDFDGKLYLDIDSGRLFDALMARYDWQERAIVGFEADGQAWLDFRGGELQSVNAKVSIPHLQLRAQGQSQAPVESVQAHVGWRHASDGGWRIDVKDLSWQWGGDSVEPIDLSIVRDSEWELRSDSIPLGSVTPMVLAMVPLGETQRRALAGYQPGGQLQNVVLRTSGDGAFALAAELDGVSVAAYDGAPGASGLKGTVNMTESAGRVHVDTVSVTLGFPELFADYWQMERLSTQVNWLIEGSRKRVWSDWIDIRYRGDTRMEGAFELVLNDPGEDTLSLRVGSWNASAPMLAEFIPVKEVDREFYDWITTAVEEASVPEGWFYGHGQINEGAPKGSFSVSMRYRFEDARLKYDEAWPVITGISGSVEVHNKVAEIQIASGETGGLQLEPSSVKVDGDVSPTTVAIETAAPFNGEDVGHWLESSPLGELVGEAASDLHLEGDFHLDLGLELALSDDIQTKADVAVKTEDAQFAYSDTQAVWQNVAGTLHYSSDSGFSGDPLTARFLGNPVELALSRPDTGAPLRITQTGRIAVADVAEQFEMSLPPGIDGRATYSARLDLSSSGASSLAVSSSLANVSLEWPAPFGKPVGAAVPMELVMSWGENDGMLLSGHWSDRLAYRLRWAGGAFQRGRVELGVASTSLSGAPGLEVTGRVEHLDLAQWKNGLSQFDLAPSSGQGGPGLEAPDWLKRVALSIGSARAAGQQFNETVVLAIPDANGWRVSLDGEDVGGELFLPAGDQPIVVDLSKVILVSEEKGTPGSESLQAAVPFEENGIAGWPDVDVIIDALRLNGRDYGAWSFLFRPAADALEIQQLKGKVGSLVFDGDVVWSARNGTEQTQIDGTLAGGSLADISPWIDGSVPLRNEKSAIEVDLGWDGPPSNGSLETVEGTLGFRLDDGVILESNNTAQIFRIFGILNSDTLLRRLKLDFSDLYEAGVAFDAISGTAQLNSGTLTWEPELQIVGPSGAFKLTGSTSLVEETLDMRLVVVLPLTQNLPLAAILMGVAPPIGGALFVLDKVLGDPLSRLTSATYLVQGTWDKPDVDLRNVFDTGD